MENYKKPVVEVITFNLGDSSLGNLCSGISSGGGIFVPETGEGKDDLIGFGDNTILFK